MILGSQRGFSDILLYRGSISWWFLPPRNIRVNRVDRFEFFEPGHATIEIELFETEHERSISRASAVDDAEAVGSPGIVLLARGDLRNI